jgi:predicted pyridoxine 5'-phosphate oxidase superfamily flavin-nucleotide-binding protein
MSSTQSGQDLARTRWDTRASGEAFDRKKSPYLTEHAQQFIAQQAMCVIAGITPDGLLDGVLVLGQPGFVQVLDPSTCLLQLEDQSRASSILRGLHLALSMGRDAWLSLFFLYHPTRERLCVHATVEMLHNGSSGSVSSSSSAASVVVRLHIREAFFHCSKYIRTRIAGLTVPVSRAVSSQLRSQLHVPLTEPRQALTEEHCRFLSQQVLCFLCTANREGRCAVNHRGGAPGFLLSFPPDVLFPGGTLILPDFAGNGAFEAIGNILETSRVALVVPNYVSHVALCISGIAHVRGMQGLRPELLRQCRGAERIIEIAVQRIESQCDDWSALLEYECNRAALVWASPALATCVL